MKFVTNWQDFAGGLILGFFITAAIGIYITEKNTKPGDWWCVNLINQNEIQACETMYEKAIAVIDHFKQEENCIPNYMGGCDPR